MSTGVETPDCHFCTDDFIDRRGPIPNGPLFNTAYDTYPLTPGHTIISSARHFGKLDQMTPAEISTLGVVVQDVGRHLMSASAELLEVYTEFGEAKPTEKAEQFANRMLEEPFINQVPDAFTYGVNDGPAAGQTIPHFHLHVVPRHEGDVEDPAFGIRNVFPPEIARYK